MRIFITGGAGFVGSHLADRLLARGDQVVVLDDYSTGRRDNLADHDDRVSAMTVIEGSIVSEHTINEIMLGFRPDVVVHAAASYKDPEDWAGDADTNVLGTVNVVKAAKQYKVKRLIYLQTSLCYGLRPLEQPVTINYPTSPGSSSYAITKTAGEDFVRLSGLDWQSFRLANAYGPRNLTGPLPTFFQRLASGKPCFIADSRRDFVYIDDMIDVLEKAVHGAGYPGLYHIASGSDVSIKEVFDAAVTALGITLDKPVEVRPLGADDAPSILLDPMKTAADFRWMTSTPLADGVALAIQWYKTHGITQTYTHLKEPGK